MTATVPLPGSTHKTPQEATRLGDEDPTRTLEATVVLAPAAAWHELTRRYLEPGAKEPFLTYDQLRESAGVDDAALQHVLAYLRQHGLEVRDISHAARTVRVRGTVAHLSAA